MKMHFVSRNMWSRTTHFMMLLFLHTAGLANQQKDMDTTQNNAMNQIQRDTNDKMPSTEMNDMNRTQEIANEKLPSTESNDMNDLRKDAANETSLSAESSNMNRVQTDENERLPSTKNNNMSQLKNDTKEILSSTESNDRGNLNTDVNEKQSSTKNNMVDNSNTDEKLSSTDTKDAPPTRTGCVVPVSCIDEADPTKSTSSNDKQDHAFFQKCIVDGYCFKKSATADAWVKTPTYRDMFTTYFNNAAKRIERYFIRNNDWSTMLDKPSMRNGEICPKLLTVIAARYHYVVYVLNTLFPDRPFGPCNYNDETKKLKNPIVGGECYVVPLRQITCTSDFDIALMGAKSGSLAARFNQFFREPLGSDTFVPGFGKSSEDIFGGNVFAFTLEYALPDSVNGVPDAFVTGLEELRRSIQFQLQEVVAAIRKMRNYLPKFYNDLLIDQAELHARKTKDNLGNIFNEIVQLFNTIEEQVSAVIGSASSTISYRFKQDMARSTIQGVIESTGKSGVVANAIVEHAMAIIFGAEVYHTTGTVRHVFGMEKMKNNALRLNVIDVWVSMLENWADCVKEYKRECEAKGLLVAQCLPKISKNLLRAVKGMNKVRNKLPDAIIGNDLFKNDLAIVETLIPIVHNWYRNFKRKGVDELPKAEKDNFKAFREIFKCDKNLKLDHDNNAFNPCLNAIQNEVRKYNRRLFTYIAYEHRI